MARVLIFILLFSGRDLFSKVVYYTFNEQCRKATEIFTGRVVAIKATAEFRVYEQSFKTYKVRFLTNTFWKGSICDTITCIASEFFCAWNIFEQGKSYLVYSTRDTITLGSGRSGELIHPYVRADVRKLNVRYLFRQPSKEQSLTAVAGKLACVKPIYVLRAARRKESVTGQDLS